MHKIVLTGTASCGKTSVIESLKEKGFSVIEETATEVLREFPDLSDKEKQIKIFEKQLQKESTAKGEIVFLDRSAIDCLTYARFFVNPFPSEVNKSSINNDYHAIFILDKLPFVQNDVRLESGDEQAELIHKELILEYKKMNHSPISVPVMEIEDRVKFILNKLNLN